MARSVMSVLATRGLSNSSEAIGIYPSICFITEVIKNYLHQHSCEPADNKHVIPVHIRTKPTVLLHLVLDMLT